MEGETDLVDGLILRRLLHYVFHVNAVVAFIIYTVAIFYQQYLWRFVMHREYLSYLIRYIAEAYQVEVVEFDVCRFFAALQAGLYHIADIAAGTVLKYHNRLIFTFF